MHNVLKKWYVKCIHFIRFNKKNNNQNNITKKNIY